nr:ABC transporter substrate-binding protein [uncultured Devosia sp.]
MKFYRIAGAILASLLSFVTPAFAETQNLRVGFQPGLTFLPLIIMQNEGMIEENAAQLGVEGLRVEWFRSAGGTTMNDGLISGSLDIAATGFPSFLSLWSKGGDRLPLKAISSYGSTRLELVTRNPNVVSIADFGDADRIAVPAVKNSVQAMILQMAAAKEWGDDQYDRLDRLTVSRSHADAAVAMLSNSGEINSHFAVPPFLQQELKDPAIRPILSSEDVFGGAMSNGVTYLTERFYSENPNVVLAFKSALSDAIDLINSDPEKAAEIYLSATQENSTQEEIVEMLGAFRYETAPRGLTQVADFLFETGAIDREVGNWKELFIPESQDLDGN